MREDTPVPEVAIVGTIVGLAVLLYGTYEHTFGSAHLGELIQAVGGTISVAVILLLAWYVHSLPEPEGAEH